MANKVCIEVEAILVDQVSGKTKYVISGLDGIGKAAGDAQKELDKLAKKKAHPVIDVENNKFLKKMRESDNKIAKFAGEKATAVLDILDKGTAKLNKAESTLKSITKKTWSTVVNLKDKITSPLKAIKNSLFSMKSLVVTVTGVLAIKKTIMEPINLADAYSSTKIGFSTLLGDAAGQAMMDQMDDFAKKTPFKTSGVISNAQKMMAYGWDPERILEDMETIGDAAAATGKMDEGLESIVYALSEIRSKGKLSTQELNQLAGAGIKAKAYLAEGLGYGTSDEGMKMLAKDLEDGAIGANQAIDLILQGMQEFDGMMDRTANETVSGLKAQIEDAFEINIFRKWGQGLQDGAKRGMGSIVELLDNASAALSKFGDMMYEIGEMASNWLADRFENAIDRIMKITDSFEFNEASLGEKISMLWKGVIADPLKEWWDNGGAEKTAETAGKIGGWIGEMLTKGLLAILGATDVLKDIDGTNTGGDVASSFVQGFLQNFDGSAITDAFVQAISNVWNALPAWGKWLVAGYGGAKTLSGISSLVNSVTTVAPILGHAGSYSAAGTGIAGGLSALGYGAVGKLAGSSGALAVSGLSGGLATAAGAGLITSTVGAVHAFNEFNNAYQSHKAGDKTSAKASFARGASTTVGIGAGALAGAKIGAGIGTLAGPVGTAVGGLIGAGLGTVVGWFAGDKIAKNIEAAKYESKELKAVLKDADATSEEINQEWEKAKWENLKNHFGDIKLSLSEIKRLSDQIVWGDDMSVFETFKSATEQAKASMTSMKSATADTERWMWKAGLGVKFNEDEQESIIASFDEYINSAKSYLENKHYEFTASADLLLDLDSEAGKSILEGGNAFYAAEQEKLAAAGEELGNALTEALKDGIISAPEEDVIIAAQEKIAEITNKIAQAEQEAEIELIKVKFGGGNMDKDSFETFMSTMKTNLEERMTTADEAFEVQVKNLNLRFPEEKRNSDEYKTQLQTIIDGYKTTVESVKADVLGVELNIIGDAYAKELGDDAAADLQNALQYAIDEGIDPVEISDKKLADLLKIDLKGNGETIDNIREMLSGVFSQMELIEVDGNLLLKVGEVQPEEGTGEKVQEAVEQTLPDTVEKTVGVNISGEKNIQTTIDILAEDFGIPPEHAATVALLLTGEKELLNQIDVSQLAAEFGIPEEQAKTVIEKLTGEKSIQNRLSVLSSDFGIPDSISKKISVNLTAIKGKITNAIGNVFGNTNTSNNSRLNSMGYGKTTSEYRGGIVGGDSALESFARGGMVRGGSRLIEVAEEGTPEMIIPLSSQRRDRALRLWEKTGELLNVPGFARGGMTRGNQDEGLRFHGFGSSEPSGGQTVQIDVGGITFEIQVNANDGQTVAEAIRAQSAEIAETVAGIMADAFGAQFENTPVRGGVA